MLKKALKIFTILTATCLTTATIPLISSCSFSQGFSIEWTGEKTINLLVNQEQAISSQWKISGSKSSSVVFKKVSDTQDIDVNTDGSLIVKTVNQPKEVLLQVQAYSLKDETKSSNIVELKFIFTYALVESVKIVCPTETTYSIYNNTAGFISGEDGNPFVFKSIVNPAEADQDVTWSLTGDTVNNKITFNQDTHQISWKAMNSDQIGSHTLTLKATSAQDPSKSDTYTFTLNVSIPTVEIQWSDSTDLPTYYNIAGTTTNSLSALVVGANALDQSIQWDIINDTSNGMVSLNTNTLKFSWNQLTTTGNYSFDVKATSTKYGSSATKHFTFTVDNALPTKLLDIDKDGVLNGFVSDFNKDDYKNKGYDTIRVPKTITGVARYCFDYNSKGQDNCPTYIKNIDFSGCSQLTYLYGACFRGFNSLVNVNFSGCSNLSKNYHYGYNFEGTNIETIDLSETGYTKFARTDEEDGMRFDNFLFGMPLKTLMLPGTLQTISTSISLANTLDQIVWKDLTSLPNVSVNVVNSVATTGTIKVTGNSTITSAQLLAHLKTVGLPTGWTAA